MVVTLGGVDHVSFVFGIVYLKFDMCTIAFRIVSKAKLYLFTPLYHSTISTTQVSQYSHSIVWEGQATIRC